MGEQNLKEALEEFSQLLKSCLIVIASMSDKLDKLKNKNKLRKIEEKISINLDLTKKKRRIQTSISQKTKDDKNKSNQQKIG